MLLCSIETKTESAMSMKSERTYNCHPHCLQAILIQSCRSEHATVQGCKGCTCAVCVEAEVTRLTPVSRNCRLDFVRGYAGEHAGDYAEASSPDFVVAEFWDALAYRKGVALRNQVRTVARSIPCSHALPCSLHTPHRSQA